MQTPFFVYNKRMKLNRRQKRNTIILIAVLLIFFAFGFVAQGILAHNARGNVVISVDGSAVATLPLSTDTSYVWTTEDGDMNKIIIENGTVYVSEANCQDLICVHTGKIVRSGEVIACLPHRLIVYVEED